jgi:hypothetical protein
MSRGGHLVAKGPTTALRCAGSPAARAAVPWYGALIHVPDVENAFVVGTRVELIVSLHVRADQNQWHIVG